jgi:hypothetical protein
MNLAHHLTWLRGTMLCLIAAVPARADVKLELHVPATETRVLGDPIPLIWRFENRSDQPLGFLWEGCCRLNGQLSVRGMDREVPVLPPGQALAHMFARADRLDPHVPREYVTLVSDWVTLPGTGAFELRGTYRGVLPFQEPQLPGGVKLWRERAESLPIRIEVLSASDYLAEREHRSAKRGIGMRLRGPSKLPPLEPARFHLAIENLSDLPQYISWPEAASVWVLNTRDERVAPSAVISDSIERLVLPAKSKLERVFQIKPDQFEGEALGEYRLFVDLAEEGMQPRVPSNPLPLSWQFDRADVALLLEAAARGAGTGARNEPLKRLRVYLAEIGDAIESLDASNLTGKARDLAIRLRKAARLKTLAPRPGTVELTVRVEPTGSMRWDDPAMQSATRGLAEGFAGQVTELLDLRRHLGWDIRFSVNAAGPTAAQSVVTAARELARHTGELMTAPVIVIAESTTNTPLAARLAPPRQPSPDQSGTSSVAKNPTLLVSRRGRAWSKAGEPYVMAGDDRWLRARFEEANQTGTAVRIEVAPALPWSLVQAAVTPVVRPGDRLELAIHDESGEPVPGSPPP